MLSDLIDKDLLGSLSIGLMESGWGIKQVREQSRVLVTGDGISKPGCYMSWVQHFLVALHMGFDSSIPTVLSSRMNCMA
jgi:hypothetical protein